METLLAPVCSWQKPNILLFNLFEYSRTLFKRVLLGTDMVTIFSYFVIRLPGVNYPWLRQKLGISVIIKTALVAKSVVMATAQQVSFCRFWWTFPGVKLEEHYFQFSIFSVCYHFSCKHHDIITFLICIIQKCQNAIESYALQWLFVVLTILRKVFLVKKFGSKRLWKPVDLLLKMLMRLLHQAYFIAVTGPICS